MLSLSFLRRIGGLSLALATPLAAQWVHYPTAGVPHTADGKPDMSAPAPRQAGGKPDFSGTWTSDEIDPRHPKDPPNPRDATTSRRMINLGVDIPGGLPYQPWLAAVVKKRRADNALDDPHIRCFPDNFLRAYGMPHLLKFVQTPNLLLVLDEWDAGYRQVFTDARELPHDPDPSFNGYSSAHWSGDTLVIETNSVTDHTWIDWNGSELTEQAKIREEMTRPDFGHMQIKVTVDDPGAYTKPWTVLIKERIILNTDLIDEICLDDERSLAHMK